MQGNDTEPPGGSFVNMSNTLLIFHGYKWKGVGGIMVSIAAFQAVDPGSIPGRRNFSFRDWNEKGGVLFSDSLIWQSHVV